MRRLILAAALVLGAGLAVPVASAATPAWAINCAYGDNFYQFWSTYSGNVQYLNANGFLTDDQTNNSHDLFCQVNPIGGFSEWVLKGTSACLTVDSRYQYSIDLSGCVAGKASQLWGLDDYEGLYHGYEEWGGIESDYMNTGYRYLADGYFYGQFTDQALTGWSPNPGSQWDWALYGPQR